MSLFYIYIIFVYPIILLFWFVLPGIYYFVFLYNCTRVFSPARAGYRPLKLHLQTFTLGTAGFSYSIRDILKTPRSHGWRKDIKRAVTLIFKVWSWRGGDTADPPRLSGRLGVPRQWQRVTLSINKQYVGLHMVGSAIVMY